MLENIDRAHSSALASQLFLFSLQVSSCFCVLMFFVFCFFSLVVLFFGGGCSEGGGVSVVVFSLAINVKRFTCP